VHDVILLGYNKLRLDIQIVFVPLLFSSICSISDSNLSKLDVFDSATRNVCKVSKLLENGFM